MEKKYLKNFVIFQIWLIEHRQTLTPKDLYIELLSWGKQLNDSNEMRIKNLYTNYLQYFDKLKIDEYLFEPLWYDFNDLIDFCLLKYEPKRLERIVVIIRDVLWEIIAFKTNRSCKILPEDNLRFLTDELKEYIYFSCDSCFYTEDLEGNKRKVEMKLYPATINQIKQYEVQPALI